MAPNYPPQRKHIKYIHSETIYAVTLVRAALSQLISMTS